MIWENVPAPMQTCTASPCNRAGTGTLRMQKNPFVRFLPFSQAPMRAERRQDAINTGRVSRTYVLSYFRRFHQGTSREANFWLRPILMPPEIRLMAASFPFFVCFACRCHQLAGRQRNTWPCVLPGFSSLCGLFGVASVSFR